MPPPIVLLSSVEVGCFFGLIGLAFFIVTEGAGFFNFAIGPIASTSAMASSYAAYQLGWSVPVALAIGLVLACVIGLLSEVIVVRPVEARAEGTGHSRELPGLIAITALLFAIEQASGILFSRNLLPGAPWIQGDPVFINGVGVDRAALLLIAVTLLIFAAVEVWIRFEAHGQMLRAIGDNQHAALVMGLPVGRIRLIAFGVSALVAGLAGSLFAFKAGVEFDSGLTWATSGFTVLVVAGRGWMWGTLVAGILFATVQFVATYYLGGTVINYTTLAIAVIFFAFRPRGLFQRRVRV